MEIRTKVGLRIKELRQEKGLSQEKFSHLCGLDRTYIASIEQGNRNVSVVNLEKISKAFNLKLNEFFRGIDEFEKNKD